MPGGAAETRYGRQGGGWLPSKPPQGKVPEVGSKAEEERRQAIQREQLRAFEKANDLPPGSAGWDGNRPAVGVTWEGIARCAAARRAAGVPLSRLDLEALERVSQVIP